MARRARGAQVELKAPLSVFEVGSASELGATAHYEDAAYYDVAYGKRRDDVAHYERLARLSGGPVLEYGVGTGRVAIPIARAGVAVTGVEASAAMLERCQSTLAVEAREVRARLRLVRGDMRTARLRRRFPLVIAPFNTVQHLYERTDFERFFARVQAHLAPGGRFVFDVLVPHADYLGADPRKRHGHPRFRHPTRGLVRYGERFDYDDFRQVLRMTLEFEPVDRSPGWAVPLTHRQIFPRELEALLHYNGFTDIQMTADFTDAPADAGADSLVVSCRAAGGRRPPRAPGVRRRNAHR